VIHTLASRSYYGVVPIAYFITFHTYGTWLHGNTNGSVSPGHNIPGTPTIAPDPHRVQRELGSLKHPPFLIDANSRRVIDQTIREVAAHRHWTIHALNIRTNHVHIVITAPSHTPERVLIDLKSWCTRRLTEHACTTPDTRIWSRHGSTRWLNSQRSFDRACEYVTQEQGDDLPMSSALQ